MLGDGAGEGGFGKGKGVLIKRRKERRGEDGETDRWAESGRISDRPPA
jgi:hypothetical protein